MRTFKCTNFALVALITVGILFASNARAEDSEINLESRVMKKAAVDAKPATASNSQAKKATKGKGNPSAESGAKSGKVAVSKSPATSKKEQDKRKKKVAAAAAAKK